MNLVKGKILNSKECDNILENLEQHILNTLNKGQLSTETVIAACNKVVTEFDESEYIDAISRLGIDQSLAKSYIDEFRQAFGKESLLRRIEVELGSAAAGQILPLGVLLHIAAGNADGLPAFSVLEGLLAGNINILKLPAAEGGISVRLLQELKKAEPQLAEYIYVFDYSSKDIEHMEKLISAADAVVVWG